MRLNRDIFVGAAFLGALLWVLDALIDWLVFFEDTFLELLITDVPAHEVWNRTLLLALCLASGKLLAWAVHRHKHHVDGAAISGTPEDGDVTGAVAEFDRLRSIVDRSPAIAITWAVGEEWPVDYVSGSIEQLGYAPEQLTSGEIDFVDIVHPEDVPRLSGEVSGHLQAGDDSFSHEYRIVTPAGAVRWIDDRTSVVRDDDGGVIRFDGILLDITERKLAEEALQESEERYRELVQNANDIIYTLSPEGAITSINGAVERILGFAPEELAGRHLSDLLGEERHARATQYYQQKLEGGRSSSTYEFDLLDRDGELVVLEINTTIRTNDDGEPVEVVGIARDITERHLAEEQLREHAEIIRQTHDLIMTVDLNGTILDVNRAEEELLGYRRDDLIGQSIFDLGEYNDQTEILRETLEQGSWRGEVVNRTADGQEVVLDTRTFVLEDAEGNPERLIGISRDVTERKRAEEALRKRTRALGERVKEMRCLYHVARLSEHSDKPIERVLQDVADVLPVSWQWPRVATARVEFAGEVYEAGGAEGAPVATQSAEITVRGETIGRVQVRYHDEMPEEDEGPFVAEERTLIDTVAASIGEMIEHREAERERDSLARFPDENPLPVLRVRGDGVVDYANGAAATLLGELGSYVGARVPEAWQDELDKAFESGRPRRFEVETGDRAFLFTLAPVAEHGYLNLYGIDVTHRKRAEEALVESEQRFRRAIAEAPFPIMLHAENGDILSINDVWTEITGYSAADLPTIGDWTERAYGERMENVREAIERLYELDRAMDEDEYEILTASGETRIWHFHSAPLGPLPDGRRLVISMAADVTARKKAQEELQALTEELEDRVRERTAQLRATNEELEAFAYSVSHDLRAPLRSIDGFSQAVVEDYAEELDDIGKDYLRRVRRASQKMGELIDDLLQLSQITRAEFQPDRVDLSALAREIVEELREAEPGRSVEVHIDPDMTADGDCNLLKAALGNLLGNAWKFTANSEQARIEFTSKIDDIGRTVYTVSDTGAGFDMAYAEKLFQPFQRLHSSDEFPGTGIGLASVRRVISRHGGEVWGEGTVGEGASFSFTLSDAGGGGDDG